MKKLLLIFIPIFSISQDNYNLNWLDQFENELNFEHLAGPGQDGFPSDFLNEDSGLYDITENSYFLGFGEDGEIAFLLYQNIDYDMEEHNTYKIIIKDGPNEKEFLLWEYWESYYEEEGDYYSDDNYYCEDYCEDCCASYCLDPKAVNYCESCIDDDEIGDCCYVAGCTQPYYFEYNPDACYEDYSCMTLKVGCTNSNAFNYCESCIEDDGSCIPIIEGCTDEAAFNYNPEANTWSDSCQDVSVKTIWKEKQKEINTFLAENFIDPNPGFYFFEEDENEIIFPSSSRGFPSTTLYNVKEYSNEKYLDEFNISEELFKVTDSYDGRIRKSIGLNIYCPVNCSDFIDDIFYGEILKIPSYFRNQQYSLLFYSRSPNEPVVVLAVAFWKFNEKTGKKDVTSIQSIPIDLNNNGSFSLSTNKKDFLKSFITYKDYIKNGEYTSSLSVRTKNYKMAISLLEKDMDRDDFIYDRNAFDVSCIYNMLANVYRSDKKYDLAISNYKKSIEYKVYSHYPGCYHSKESVYRVLASLHYDMEEYSESAEYYTKIINLNNELTDYQKATLYYDRGRAYAYSNYSSHLKQAVADLLFAENIYKEIGNQAYKQSLCFFYSGWASYEMEDYQSSIDYYTKAIELRPNDSAGYNNRGICYAAVSLYKFAINDYDKAIDLSPKSGLYYSNKANALKSLGEPYCDFYKKACELGYQDACGSCY